MSKKEKWVCGLTFILLSFIIISLFSYKIIKQKKLFLGYLDKIEIAKKMKSDPKFDYDKFENNLNQFMKEQLK